MAESKYCNHVDIDHKVQSRNGIPSDYHCTCDYCKNFMGEIFHNDSSKHYSNRIRKDYYIDEAGDHLDAGHIIGYRWAIQNLCPEDGIVLDPTVGTGTAIVEAINNKRDAIGIELEYPEVAQKNIDAQLEHPRTQGRKYWFRQGNSLNIDEYLDEWGIEKGDIDLIVNGTPYPRVSAKSSDAPERKNLKTGEDKSFDYYHEENIGITKGDAYWDLVRTMYTKSISYLKPGGYFVIIIKDMVQNKAPYLLHKEIADVVLEANPDMEHYGFFLHSHTPTTMFQNTYGKRFPGIPIPWYQVGVVLRKKGGDGDGFIYDHSGRTREVSYKLHDANSEYTVSYRDPAGQVTWKKNGESSGPPDMTAKVKAKPKKKKVIPSVPKEDREKLNEGFDPPKKKNSGIAPIENGDLDHESPIPLCDGEIDSIDLSQFKSPGISITDDIQFSYGNSSEYDRGLQAGYKQAIYETINFLQSRIKNK